MANEMVIKDDWYEAHVSADSEVFSEANGTCLPPLRSRERMKEDLL